MASPIPTYRSTGESKTCAHVSPGSEEKRLGAAIDIPDDTARLVPRTSVETADEGRQQRRRCQAAITVISIVVIWLFGLAHKVSDATEEKKCWFAVVYLIFQIVGNVVFGVWAHVIWWGEATGKWRDRPQQSRHINCTSKCGRRPSDEGDGEDIIQCLPCIRMQPTEARRWEDNNGSAQGASPQTNVYPEYMCCGWGPCRKKDTQPIQRVTVVLVTALYVLYRFIQLYATAKAVNLGHVVGGCSYEDVFYTFESASGIILGLGIGVYLASAIDLAGNNNNDALRWEPRHFFSIWMLMNLSLFLASPWLETRRHEHFQNTFTKESGKTTTLLMLVIVALGLEFLVESTLELYFRTEEEEELANHRRPGEAEEVGGNNSPGNVPGDQVIGNRNPGNGPDDRPLLLENDICGTGEQLSQDTRFSTEHRQI